MKVLLTKRLMLRAFSQKDAFDMFEYASDLRVGPNAGFPIHESVEKSKEIIEMFHETNDIWAIVLSESNKVIGSVGLHEQRVDPNLYSGDLEIGYVLNPKFWGQGIIPEAVNAVLNYAFSDQQTERVWCGHYLNNKQSQRVNEKVGFKFRLIKNGKEDVYYYSLSKEEYFNHLVESREVEL